MYEMTFVCSKWIKEIRNNVEWLSSKHLIHRVRQTCVS